MLLALTLGGGILARAAYLQLLGNPRLETLAKRQFQSKVLVRPRRGPILDRNGEPLAINVETQSLAANPSKVRNPHTLARLLAKATGMPEKKLLQRLGEKREFVWIKRHIPESEINQFRKWQIIDGNGDLAAGLWLVRESERVHPHGELAAHILGDVNVDSEGLEGVELWQDDKLRGKVVSVSAIKDALGRPTFIDTVAAKDVKDGEPVHLTIDASLQFEVEQELKLAVARTGARSGSAVVMNAVTGEILAMANDPTYNPDNTSAPADRRRNRAITDGYEPGSTMKAVLLSGALSRGSRLTDQVWGGKGELKVQGRRISEAESHERWEWISLKKMIQVSSNVAAARLALKMGVDNYYSVLKSFGFGAKTDVGFPGEISGRVPAKKDWQPLSLATMAFGQGMLVTPIQMVRAYATFLNGGWLVQPSLLKDSDPRKKSDPPVRILNPKVSEQVLEALESVTQKDGTGVKATLEGYRVAGKTGTAQVVDPATRTYSRSRYISSFIGFPLDVEPKVVIFAALDDPRGVYYASETAAPLFREILRAVGNRFSIPTKMDPAARVLASKSALKPAARAAKAKDEIHVTQAAIQWQGTTPSGKLMWKMPGVKGFTAREAIRAIKGRQFQLEIQGSGVVRQQHPEEGNSVAEGDTIRLVLGEP